MQNNPHNFTKVPCALKARNVGLTVQIWIFFCSCAKVLRAINQFSLNKKNIQGNQVRKRFFPQDQVM